MKAPKSKILKIILCAALVLSAAWLYIIHHKIRAERYLKEANFIMLHEMAIERLTKSLDDPPRNLSELLAPDYAYIEPIVMKCFPEGLVYQPTKDGFVLEGASPCFISLFQRDRLVSSEKNWPHWERSHKYATR